MRNERIDSLSLSSAASGAIALTDRKSGSHLVSVARSVQSCAIAGFLGNYRIDRSVRRCVALAFGSATYRLKRLNATKTRRVHATPLWGRSRRSSRSRATAVSCWLGLDSLSISLSLSLVLSTSPALFPSLSLLLTLSLFLSSRLSLLTCLH